MGLLRGKFWDNLLEWENSPKDRCGRVIPGEKKDVSALNQGICKKSEKVWR